ncbi:PP2C family protein-serine/threonine phosphatase [Actinacidiphila glaucinigra]|uniref:PP2C family protein-serine/threonine phosphatase n=1 Tax=Actinacidiphila glaucinigra TaxID=235986 RepID=UPI002E367D67|nr:PP2C family protein-serine/threonine phosphatase [Actinacidiphila glaucinigra]
MPDIGQFEEEPDDGQPLRHLAVAGGALWVLAVCAVCVILPLYIHPSLACGIASLVTAGVVAVVMGRVQDRYRHGAARALVVADTVRRTLLRPLPERVGALGLASVYRACGGRGQVGGDLYAVARKGRTTRLIIGDVCGKGLPTFEDVAAVLGAFREWAPRAATLAELSARLEESFLRHLGESDDPARDTDERFVTALLLEVRDGERLARMVNHGHPPPVQARRGSVALVAGCPSPPLGLHALRECGAVEQRFELDPGDTLLLYTDGLVEARDAAGHCYPLLDRATAWRWVRQGGPADCERLPDALGEILRDLVDHAGALPKDDLAMVALTRMEEPATALPRPAGEVHCEDTGQLRRD